MRKPPNTRIPYDAELLKIDEMKAGFIEAVGEIDSHLTDWESYTAALLDAAKQSIPRRKGKKSDNYISDATLQLIDERRKEYLVSPPTDERVVYWKRTIQRQLRSDYNAWMHRTCKDVTDGAANGSVKQYYAAAKKLGWSKKRRSVSTITRTSLGAPITSEAVRLKEYERFLKDKFTKPDESIAEDFW